MRKSESQTRLGLAILAGVVSIGSALWVGFPSDKPNDENELLLTDVAADVGLDVQHSAFQSGVTGDPVAMMGGGACWIDVDRDGWLDLFLTDTWSNGEWGAWNALGQVPTLRIFRNVDGTFEDYTEQWNVGIEARSGGCVAADIDNDGFTDLFVTTERENLLLWNDSGVGFTEAAALAGVDTYGWYTGVAAGDLNQDGLLDLVVAGYADLNKAIPDASTGFPNTFESIGDLVLVNQGSINGNRPTFVSVGAAVGLEPDGPEYGLAVLLVDFDADGDIDLHIANDSQPNRLYLNQADPDSAVGFVFVDASQASGADDPNSGMGVAAADLNNDAVPDLVVTNLAGQGHVGLLSTQNDQGIPQFSPGLSSVRGLGDDRTGWGVSFGDLDLDGDVDLLVASGAIPIDTLDSSSETVSLFINNGLSFSNKTSAAGLDAVAARNGRSIALADYDNDGDLDVLVTAIGQPVALLENTRRHGHWLIIDAGAPSPGMQVRVELADGTVLTRLARAGGSWLSSEDPRIHFGLGNHDKAAVVEVIQPDGTVRRFDSVEADQIVFVGT